MAPAPVDLCLVLPHLGAGGAQKVALLAAEHFIASGLRVQLVTLLPGVAPAHELPVGLDHVDLGPALACRLASHRLLRSLHRCLAGIGLRLCAVGNVDWTPPLSWCAFGVVGPRALLLRRHWQSQPPRRVLAFLSRTNLISCLAMSTLPGHLVVSERNDLRSEDLPLSWRRLRPLLFRRADVVTANSAGTLESLALLGLPQPPVLLPNPLPSLCFRHGAGRARSGCLCIARLVRQKGLDVLIEAWARLPAISAGLMLTLVGEGPERGSLEAQAEQCGARSRIRFTGHCRDVSAELKSAAIFVLPSRKEGTPNALLEAMAAGLAVVVSDASPGPLALVENGVTGLVVPVDDAAALASALQRLISDPDLCASLGAAAAMRMRKHGWDVLEPQWRTVLALS